MPKKKTLVPGDFNLAVKRSSAGLGLFAKETIEKGACVIEYTGKRLTQEEYRASNSRYLFDVGRNRTIDGAPRWNRARYINHSCRPNCDIEIQKGRVFIQARRRIKPGEELSYDYGKEYFDEYIGDNCRCLKCMPVQRSKAIVKTKTAPKTRKALAKAPVKTPARPPVKPSVAPERTREPALETKIAA